MFLCVYKGIQLAYDKYTCSMCYWCWRGGLSKEINFAEKNVLGNYRSRLKYALIINNVYLHCMGWFRHYFCVVQFLIDSVANTVSSYSVNKYNMKKNHINNLSLWTQVNAVI